MQTPIRAHRDPPAGTDTQAQVPGAGQRPPPWRTVALAGLLAGALDITFAFIFYGRQGVNPALILRGIASGVLGPSAFALGTWTLALGALLHFFIALCAAFVFYFASRRLAILTRRPLACGAAFGVAMYLAMHFIVLPLSRVHFRLPTLHNVIGELCSHVFLFGMIIALGVARAAGSAARTADRSGVKVGLIFAFVVSCLGVPGVARSEGTAAQASTSCTASEYRQLDFWLGDWDVYDVEGASQSVARARITRILDGCVVHELYESADGARGESFSIFDHTRRLWHQSWVTNRGRLLQIEGGIEGGRVVLTGRYLDNAGRPMVIRGSWWPVPAGVRESAEISSDDGRSWKSDFDLIFRPHRD